MLISDVLDCEEADAEDDTAFAPPMGRQIPLHKSGRAVLLNSSGVYSVVSLTVERTSRRTSISVRAGKRDGKTAVR